MPGDTNRSVHDRIDVHRVLEEGLLAGASVVAGATGLGRLVSWCLPLAEVLGTARRLSGVVVVCRSGDLTAAVLADLTARDAAALGVVGAVDTIASTVPAATLPVIALPPRADYPMLSQLIGELVIAKEAHVLRFGVTVHRALADLLYRGGGLSAIGRQLSRLSGCPVFILDPAGRALASEYESHRGRGGGVGPVPVPPDPPGEDVTPGVVTMTTDGFTCLASPIVLGGRHDGWVVLVELEASPSWHELARHRVIIEQATVIVGSELLRLRSVEVAEERARGDFLHALLFGRFAGEHELSQRAGHYGLDTAGAYVVVTAYTGAGAGLHTLTRHAAAVLSRAAAPTMGTVVGDMIVLIRQLPTVSRDPRTGGLGTADLATQAAEYAAAVGRDLAARGYPGALVSYGRPVSGAAAIRFSYEEARIAMGVCQRLDRTGVAGYAELRIFVALMELVDSARGQGFATEILAPLRRASRAGAGDLEHAVLAYITAGGNLNAAARELQMHRNTMLYKVERASRALGMDLRDAESQFTVWLAYRIEMLSDVTGEVRRELSPAS